MATNSKYMEMLNAAYDRLGTLVGLRPGTIRISQPYVIDEPLAVYVETTGNDNNPGTASLPFRTIQAAVAYLKQGIISAPVTIFVGAGTHAGVTVEGVETDTSANAEAALTIEGTWAAVTPTTGAATGTAGVGSTSTSLVKPAAAANWTANDLRGKFVHIISGGGASGTRYPRYVPIYSNTTTALSIKASGVDDTTVFAIVTPSTTLGGTTGFTAVANKGVVALRGVKFSSSAALLSSRDNRDLTIESCLLDANQVSSLSLDRDLTIKDCSYTSTATLTVTDTAKLTIENCYNNAGGPLRVQNVDTASIQVTARATPGHALEVVDTKLATVECVANSCLATPIYLESVDIFRAVGSGLLSGSANTGYGVEIAKAGHYTLTGASVTGSSGDCLFLGTSVPWATMSHPGYGIVSEHAASAVANNSYTKAIVYGNRLFNDNVDISGRLLLYGYMNVSSNLVVPTLTGTDALDMEAGTINGAPGGFGSPRSMLEVICNSATATVALPSNAAIAGHLVTVANTGSQSVTIVSTGGSITGTATVAAGAAGIFVSLNGSSGKAYMRVA